MLLFTCIYYVLPCTICFASVVAAEKQHQNLLDGVEHFDKTQMKHTTTEEKNPLPPIEGLFLLLYNFLPILVYVLFKGHIPACCSVYLFLLYWAWEYTFIIMTACSYLLPSRDYILFARLLSFYTESRTSGSTETNNWLNNITVTVVWLENVGSIPANNYFISGLVFMSVYLYVLNGPCKQQKNLVGI